MTAEWISVDERLPKPHTLVLTWEKARCPQLNFVDQIQMAERFLDGQWCQRSDKHFYEITHWMPLPEPPAAAKRIGGAQ